ncbi:MAG: hypothetical protein HW378_1141 [Anaerolineales bacterium]|jgi:hypothetical protein|nr:hypothetical protein [Anaerolineales bacterium]MBM2851118.1 hypothetical protein [Anaerolineales bacterium]
MTNVKHKPHLHGWDDEKLYYFDETGVEWCVNDHPELLVKLTEICKDYFAQRVATNREDKQR